MRHDPGGGGATRHSFKNPTIFLDAICKTKISPKWGRKYIEIRKNFERNSYSFVRSFSRISNENFVGNIDILNIRGQYECVKIRIVWFLCGL